MVVELHGLRERLKQHEEKISRLASVNQRLESDLERARTATSSASVTEKLRLAHEELQRAAAEKDILIKKVKRAQEQAATQRAAAHS